MDKLNILWTIDNKDTVYTALVIYAMNSISMGWWKKVNVIIWGASAKLVGNDPEVRQYVEDMIESGITVEACRNCADYLKVTEILEKIGVDVKYMGNPLTEYIKAGEKILTI